MTDRTLLDFLLTQEEPLRDLAGLVIALDLIVSFSVLASRNSFTTALPN